MSQKDMRNADLMVPYVAPSTKKTDAGDIASTISGTMPMAAMFTRNKLIGCHPTLLTWMAETPDQKKNASTPAYMSVFMSLMAVLVVYMPLFLPPMAQNSGAKAPAT
ncbi:hypothetical protein FQN57_002248 [Myotisia sp. PD_48]|nr:hypothetical protein FQN57_002248 [Myotisia sp. PD_48]